MKARVLILVLMVSIFLAVQSFAALTCTNTAMNFSNNGSTYTFDIYSLRTNAGTGAANNIRVGLSSFLFNVDQTGGFDFTTAPVLSNVNAKYTGADPLTNDYGPMSAQWSHTSVYKVNISINYTGNGAAGAGSILNTTDELICTVTLKINTKTNTANLTWDQVASSITTSNSAACTNSYVGTDNSLLPVELTSFTASANRLNAQLKWSTATEKNNYGFEIERRSVETANAAWAKVGFVQGAGTSSSKHEYAFSEQGVAAGRYAYRLKQVDNDGAFKYSQSTEVEIGLVAKELTLSSNYPNPFNPTTNIEFTVATDGKAMLKVYNAIGQEVAELFNGVAQAGRIIQTRFDASRLASGIYFSRLQVDGKSLVKRMMFIK